MPRVSAIICTLNRCDALVKALQSILALDLDGITFELVVVDNGSRDRTAATVRDFAAGAPFSVHYVFESRPGLSAARNAGIAAASGDLLLFTDDDCIVSPSWAKTAVRLLAADRLRVIGGRVELANPAHLPLTIKTDLERAEMTRRSAAPGFIHGANMAFGRPVVERIGLFDIRLGAGSAFRSAEDMDFSYRAACAGVPVSYEPDFLVLHDHGRTSQSEWYKLMHGYSVGIGAAMMKHLLHGRIDLVRSLYWDLASIFRRHRDVRAITLHLRLWLAAAVGAMRFLVLASWRPSA